MSDEKIQADPLLEFWHGQGTAVIHLSKLKPLLAQHGFHIVTEAEKRVLAECMAIPEYALRSPIIYAEQFHPLRDELERLRRTP